MNDHKPYHSDGELRPHQQSMTDLVVGGAPKQQDDASPQFLGKVRGKARDGTGAALRGGYDFVSFIGHYGLLVFEKLGAFLRYRHQSGSHWGNLGLALLVVLMVGLSVLYYAMGSRALPVSFLKEQIKSALAASFNGATVKIDKVLLQRDTLKGGFFVRLTNMELREQNGAVIAASPETAIGLKFLPLLVGRVAPDSLSLIGPEVHLMRDEAGNWNFRGSRGGRQASGQEVTALGAGRLDAASLAELGDFAKASLEGAHRQLQRSADLSFIGVREAKVVLYDRGIENGDATEEVWLMPSFTLQYDQSGVNRLVGSGILKPQTADQSEVWFAIDHAKGEPHIGIRARLQNVVPEQLVGFMPALSSLTAVKLGISGAFNGRVDLREGLESGELQILLSEGEIGIFGPEGPHFAVTRGAFDFAMEAGAKHIVMRQGALTFPTGEVELKGDVWREDQESGPGDWRFQLYSTVGELYANDHLSDGARIDEFSFAGHLFATKIPVSIDEMRVQIGGASLLLAHDTSQGFPAILRGRFQNISLALLKTNWPKDFLSGSWDFLFERVEKGVIKNGAFAFRSDISADTMKVATVNPTGTDLKTGVFPAVEFDVAGLRYTLFDAPLPLEAEGVKFQIRGNRLSASMKAGQLFVDDDKIIKLADGVLSIADIHKADARGAYEFDVAGRLPTMLDLLARPPFAYQARLTQEAEKIDGEVKGRVTVKTPLVGEVVPQDVVFGGSLLLREGAATFGKFKLSNGVVKFEFGNNTVEANGTMLINGTSAGLAWGRKLVVPDDYKVPPLVLKGVLDAADRNQLGLQVNHIVKGEVPLEVVIREVDEGQSDLHVIADLTSASLQANALGWSKEAGRSTRLKFDVVKGSGGDTLLDNFKIEGEDLTLRGVITLDNNSEVRGFNFPAISYKVISNIALSGSRLRNDQKGRHWRVNASGRVFDGRGILQSLLQTGKVGSPRSGVLAKSEGIELTANFETVLGWHQAQMKKFKFKMRRQGDELKAFQLSGKMSRRGDITGEMVAARSGEPTIVLKSNNAGEALRLVGFYPNMLGGKGQLLVRYNVKKRQLASKTGRLLINRFSIASDPVVREVLSNAAQGKKGSKLTAQEHIPFNRLVAPFSIGYRQFVLHDSYVKGDLLGATMRGQLDFQKNRVRLSGTYVPLYGLNAAVGAVPVLGDILVGREGEGMLGITFGIYGDLNRPEVLVNPMSLVAPGVFRQIFEFEQKSPKIKARPDADGKGSIRLDSSASRVQRRKAGDKTDDGVLPETSASDVQRR